MIAPEHYDLLPKTPHFPAKAKAMISLFMIGGPSQMDLFDPKPMLTKYDGPPIIKSEIIAFAFARKCGAFGSRSKCSGVRTGFTGAASNLSSRSKVASASEPRPNELARIK